MFLSYAFSSLCNVLLIIIRVLPRKRFFSKSADPYPALPSIPLPLLFPSALVNPLNLHEELRKAECLTNRLVCCWLWDHLLSFACIAVSIKGQRRESGELLGGSKLASSTVYSSWVYCNSLEMFKGFCCLCHSSCNTGAIHTLWVNFSALSVSMYQYTGKTSPKL